MIEGLKERKYVQTRRKRMAPLSLLVSLITFSLVLGATASVGKGQSLFDLRSALVVLGGTTASIIFQFDIAAIFGAAKILLQSFLGTPDKDIRGHMKELDDAILRGLSLSEIRKSEGLTGDILDDVVFMHSQGMLFDEIDQFVTGRIKDQYFDRDTAVSILQKASMVAPAFGLFGTVIGLVHVMQSMSNPSQIGPSMSLALMTTAYGAGLASVIFTPLAGRLEHHNGIYIEVHKQLLSKIGVLITREERSFDRVRIPMGA
ncbi:MAG: MotA/TolQ/ExbB proton channel family protein [Proteobacteria bacterium]|nr:MotA/TolQ/ExbB proton channel family protein [Pseudomonadota bacterium]